jgi:hypothetical protein
MRMAAPTCFAVIPAKAGIHGCGLREAHAFAVFSDWIPAFAGMTEKSLCSCGDDPHPHPSPPLEGEGVDR